MYVFACLGKDACYLSLCKAINYAWIVTKDATEDSSHVVYHGSLAAQSTAKLYAGNIRSLRVHRVLCMATTAVCCLQV